MAAGEIPKFTWGASYANTLELGYPLDMAVSYPEPRQGTEFAQGASGEEDAWLVGPDYYLRGEAGWIPYTSGTTPDGTSITGYDGATGWRGFLAWCWAGNAPRFFPLRSSGTYVASYLVEPRIGAAPSLEPDGKRRVKLLLRNASGEYAGY